MDTNNRRECFFHASAFKAQFQSDLFRCGHGCEQYAPEWEQDEAGYAINPDRPKLRALMHDHINSTTNGAPQ